MPKLFQSALTTKEEVQELLPVRLLLAIYPFVKQT